MTSFLKLHKKAGICIVIILVLAATVAAGISLLMKPDRIAEGSTRQNAIRLSKMNLTKSVSATGTLESSKSKAVTANVNNIVVKKVLAVAGDSVKKGDTLVTFDESNLKDAMAEAEENLEDARSEANRSIASAQKKVSDAQETFAEEKTKLARKVSEAKSEKTKAKKEVSKIQKQLAAAKDANEKAKLSEQLTKARETVKQADSAYENALENQSASNKQNQTGVENAKEALETAQRNGDKSIKEAKRQLKEAGKNLAECSVTAPMDGTVTSVSVEEGTAYAGGTMMQIEDVHSFVVTSSVDEYDISNVETGQKVVILTEATGEEELEGEITFVAPSIGTSQTQQTGSGSMGSVSSDSSGYEIKIQVNSSNDALKLGMTAKCSIILEEAEDVFAVPYDAVHTNKDGTKVVYVQEGGSTSDNQLVGQADGGNDRPAQPDGTESDSDGKDTSSGYREITVTTGMESDYYVEVSGDGLEEGMRILIPTDETVSSSEESEEKDTAFSFGEEIPGGMGSNPSERKGNGNPPQDIGGRGMKGNN